ncbi:MAG TPA: ribosomal protein S18-alanine N-acetyltransferase [Armatimonadota bacterium]|nr:ribosomal protein S18-alanine N-acetyltransferase [Armatimonadota bacterium]
MSGDIEAIIAIENTSFSAPWPPEAFEEELSRRIATYLVAMTAGQLAGYAGMWCVAGEAHIMNIAVAPSRRRRGIGEALLLTLIDNARERGSALAYLERRESNDAAARLYAKLGFQAVGRRRRYYRDTGEDAILMVLSPLDDECVSYQREHWTRWEEQHGQRPNTD